MYDALRTQVLRIRIAGHQALFSGRHHGRDVNIIIL